MAYKYFAAVYTTNIIENDFDLIIDPVTVKVYKNKTLEYSVASKVSHILNSKSGGSLVRSEKLTLTDSGVYLEIIVRTKEKDVIAAKLYCETELNKVIGILSSTYGFNIFDTEIYRGWIYKNDKVYIDTWATRAEPLIFDHDAILNAEKKYSAISDEDIRRRYNLMTKFLVRALRLEPSEEKFVMLWTILEIYPMKGVPRGNNDWHSIYDYLGPILDADKEIIENNLKIKELYKDYRCGVIHAGELNTDAKTFGEVMDRLEAIVFTVLRSMIGLEYIGTLDPWIE